jgi:hypothetical protein
MRGSDPISAGLDEYQDELDRGPDSGCFFPETCLCIDCESNRQQNAAFEAEGVSVDPLEDGGMH